MDEPRAPIATPCIKLCVVDGESCLQRVNRAAGAASRTAPASPAGCVGCQRTLAEVAGWTRLSDAERAEIMAALPARRIRIRPEKLALFG
jgi:predicted Fe-S protein YdhL (DUF1289 family)